MDFQDAQKGLSGRLTDGASWPLVRISVGQAPRFATRSLHMPGAKD
jgi:hypothetical protein